MALRQPDEMSASDNPFSRRHQQPLLLFAEVAYQFVDEEAREGVRFADGVPLDGQTEPPRGHQGVMVVVRQRNQGAIAPHTSTLAVVASGDDRVAR